MTVWLHLFHGRDHPEEQPEDWGYNGPTLGPFKYIHCTYMSDPKFSMEKVAFSQAFPEAFGFYVDKCSSNLDGPYVEGHFKVVNDLIEFKGKFYGDWSITSEEKPI